MSLTSREVSPYLLTTPFEGDVRRQVTPAPRHPESIQNACSERPLSSRDICQKTPHLFKDLPLTFPSLPSSSIWYHFFRKQITWRKIHSKPTKSIIFDQRSRKWCEHPQLPKVVSVGNKNMARWSQKKKPEMVGG